MSQLRADAVNILLVDDQPAKLLTYEAILGELGENLIKARSARAALEQLLKNEVAVVLVDVQMPELDGFELAGMIREHPRYRGTALIFVSAVHMSDLDRLRGYQSGAVDYVSVPVVPEILRAKVAVFCDLFRKTRQLEALNRDLEKRVLERPSSRPRRRRCERARSASSSRSRSAAWPPGTWISSAAAPCGRRACFGCSATRCSRTARRRSRCGRAGFTGPIASARSALSTKRRDPSARSSSSTASCAPTAAAWCGCRPPGACWATPPARRRASSASAST